MAMSPIVLRTGEAALVVAMAYGTYRLELAQRARGSRSYGMLVAAGAGAAIAGIHLAVEISKGRSPGVITGIGLGLGAITGVAMGVGVLLARRQ